MASVKLFILEFIKWQIPAIWNIVLVQTLLTQEAKDVLHTRRWVAELPFVLAFHMTWILGILRREQLLILPPNTYISQMKTPCWIHELQSSLAFHSRWWCLFCAHTAPTTKGIDPNEAWAMANCQRTASGEWTAHSFRGALQDAALCDRSDTQPDTLADLREASTAPKSADRASATASP